MNLHLKEKEEGIFRIVREVKIDPRRYKKLTIDDGQNHSVTNQTKTIICYYFAQSKFEQK